MAEHIERYDEFARFLAQNGYIVYGHNQRGHKGSIATYEDYGYMSADDNFFILVSDVSEIVNKLNKEYQNCRFICSVTAWEVSSFKDTPSSTAKK